MIHTTSFAIQITANNNLAILINIPNTLDLISLTYKINTTNLFNELKDLIINKLEVEYA